ncbi:hypothetical protein OF83DRAFT_1181048 [Amylostereum chailletii]|nr:hypothetical protein OF83DRAFT_1181048 [Amylostereum chailletii]
MASIFLCLFVVSAYDLIVRKGKKSHISMPMAFTGISLILLATARFIIDTTNVFVAFVGHDPRSERIVYLQDVKQQLFTTKHCILITALTIGDSFVSYRCWIVWGKRLYIILLPVTLTAGSFASGTYLMWSYSNLPNQTVLTEQKWLKPLFSLSLASNAVATSLLAYRIWDVERQSAHALDNSQARLMPIVRIVLESGAISAAYLFAYVMCLSVGSQGLELMSEMATPLTGIVFTIVIVRIAFHQEKDGYWSTKPTTLRFTRQKKVTRSTDILTTTQHGIITVELAGDDTLTRDDLDHGLQSRGSDLNMTEVIKETDRP